MRETEGGNIYGDFIKRADLIEEKLLQVEARSPQVVEEYQERLSERINDLLEKYNQTIEPERLLQEVAIFADRCRRLPFLPTVPALRKKLCA